ncbi:hypothetical protein [Sphingosinicella rhizophila]|uniref:Uncharacterized protein n=1 Tax=Sphingosinicella rhizophila TaxID=3050082 RepID=A0ABU3QD10_9SPHN|nr:hypothetical protein [Sphingosinicella sp. GR2756]MDT9600883.1 hypothetical protein [Sphingosinicella sp. GR2756]
MLGDILAAARTSTNGFQAWLQKSDPALAVQVAEAAMKMDTLPAGYVRAAIADFARFAAEEDWATLISSLRNTDDPGTICLLAMVHWRLTAPACGNHSYDQHHHRSGAANDQSTDRSA